MRQIQILHVVGGMNRGGVETWLMQVLRTIDREIYKMDFLVHTTEPCPYDEEVRSLGSKIIPCPRPDQPWSYAHRFKQLLTHHGPYDIVHSHVHNYSGFILRLAKQLNIPIRIAHSHNDTTTVEATAGLYRQFYLYLTEVWIRRYATLGLACSKQAAASLFGSCWQADSRWQVLPYGIDLSQFKMDLNQAAWREMFNIPSHAFVVGHVGRFSEQKNHTFLIDIAAAVLQQESDIYFLLIGDGVLKPTIQQQVQDWGLGERILFAGLQSNVPSLMRAAMDCFVFPSYYEGLGLVLVEAQAAGLPCLISDRVPVEATVIPSQVKRLSLNQPASNWAEHILAIQRNPIKFSESDALVLLEQSQFNIQTATKQLLELYQKYSFKEVVI